MIHDHTTFMRRAIHEAAQTMKDGRGGPFGAVIVKQNSIVSTGSNRVVRTCDPTAHAEITAIRKACKKLQTHVLKGCILYTSCEPCPMCLSAIYWARIDQIVFGCTKNDASAAGFDDSVILNEIQKPTSERSVSMVQMLRNEALQLFNLWENNPEKVPY